MKKAIMNTVIILFALAMCVGCGQSSGQKEESVTADGAKAKEQVQEKAQEEAQSQDQVPEQVGDEETLENGEQIFRVVEVMPQFPGGDAELLKFIAKNIEYPQESQTNGDQGRVICSFVVTSDGSLTNFKVLRGLTPLLDQEAMRVIKMMPRWTPGTQRGKPVAVKYTVPITFKLQ
ncbi:MAG: energy transducer TonB [Parabacteroides sp.]|nr:energy transducer TonB [Parabacteroides sp.]